MSYVKTVWETGDVITAEKLNNMEDQIEKLTPLIIEHTGDDVNVVLNKTWQEIKDLFDAGQTMAVGGPPAYVEVVMEDSGNYRVGIYSPYLDDGNLEFITFYSTDSASGYPALLENM